MQKGFAGIIVLIVVLILAGLGGAYYFGKSQVPKSQTPQITPVPFSTPDASPVPTGAGETANWKTYTNAEFKFQMKYPSGWYVGKQSGAIYISDNPIPDIPLTHGLPSAFQMAIDLISNSEDFNPSWKTQKSVILVGGVQGKKFVDLEPSPALEIFETRIIVDKSPYRYTFVFRNQDNHENYNPIFNQIISTFKFTQ